ncbi:hypothetical protein [Lactococcus kimchii]|uniref:hypothetical protein n=1 Tax=Lactococcus sp. S-13 TaxID=2507158 RepID=UPI001023D866|nr:hypothetical protein [Lactococcus sp. S-13]RZI48889.1 hypothetical protein EQJ87_05230 [Lactococcus sp. S-13]
MTKSRIFALIGNLLFTLLVLLALGSFWIILLMKNSAEFVKEVTAMGVTSEMMGIALGIAAAILLVLLVLSWLAFARWDKGKFGRIYLLVLGIFYGLASMFNGAGLVMTLPLAVCFVLAYVFGRQENLETDKKNY